VRGLGASVDANAGHAASTVDERLEMLRAMLEIRLFEQEVQSLFLANLVRGSTHLCQGQEAVAVGACRALKPGDGMTCTYRGHGAVLAMGAPLDRSFGEILGKRQGLCGGKGGSMHLTDVSVGAYGSFAIVGAHLPIAAGIALAAKYRGSGAVSLCIFGDGSTNIGGFHESLNFAAVLKLPVVFLCENNLYGEYSPLAATTSVNEISVRAGSYGITGHQVDGNDVLAVRAAVRQAAERARAGEGPTLLEALTYRQVGHSRSDPGKYRPAGELDAWLLRDPIVLMRSALAQDGVAEERIAQAESEAEAAVGDALERAKAWPAPELESRFENVWA
jgi:acetoin:2,6-dichlorophenolindophenol oxidoreductase subunit alpha